MGKLDEIPVEKLANAVMMQLARRDIMVFDVKISEFIKRSVSFKETKGGVLIKNKKFLLDGTVEVVEAEEDIPPPEYLQQQQPPPRPRPVNQPIRWEVFDPDPMMLPILSRKYRLTPKRKYAIFEEKAVNQRVNMPGGGATEVVGYEYLIMDDQGQRVKISAINFVPEQRGLIGMGNTQMNEHEYAQAPKLMHMGHDGNNDMPVLRR
jgi:hypothetical protein